MATTLYRLNEDDSIEEISVPGEHVQESLNAGYVPSKADLEPKPKTAKAKPKKDIAKLSKEDVTDAKQTGTN